MVSSACDPWLAMTNHALTGCYWILRTSQVARIRHNSAGFAGWISKFETLGPSCRLLPCWKLSFVDSLCPSSFEWSHPEQRFFLQVSSDIVSRSHVKLAHPRLHMGMEWDYLEPRLRCDGQARGMGCTAPGAGFGRCSPATPSFQQSFWKGKAHCLCQCSPW